MNYSSDLPTSCVTTESRFSQNVVLRERETAMAQANPIRDRFHAVTPYLVLDNAADAIEFYNKALGAEELCRSTPLRRPFEKRGTVRVFK